MDEEPPKWFKEWLRTDYNNLLARVKYLENSLEKLEEEMEYSKYKERSKEQNWSLWL